MLELQTNHQMVAEQGGYYTGGEPMRKALATVALAVALTGCPGGGEEGTLVDKGETVDAKSSHQVEFVDKCMVLEQVPDGYLIECQSETWFIETDEPSKVQDEMTVLFVFESLTDGAYDLIGMYVLDIYHW